MPIWHGFFRCDTYAHVMRAKRNGVKGNMLGEGRLLGGSCLHMIASLKRITTTLQNLNYEVSGVFMFAPGDRGVVFEHFERSWGDHAKIPEVVAAIKRAK